METYPTELFGPPGDGDDEAVSHRLAAGEGIRHATSC